MLRSCDVMSRRHFPKFQAPLTSPLLLCARDERLVETTRARIKSVDEMSTAQAMTTIDARLNLLSKTRCCKYRSHAQYA